MTLAQITAYSITAITFFLAMFIYGEYIYWAGFTDGFITELERAEIVLYKIFIAISLLVGFYTLYLGASTAKKINKSLTISILLYTLIIIILFSAEYYFRIVLKLMDSAGG